jgi:predicted transcriptional regulator of viral defense system
MESLNSPSVSCASPPEALRRLESEATYLFTPDEFASRVGRAGEKTAVKRVLDRLSAKGLVASVRKKPPLWVLVPAEQAHYGAPPVTWWIDDLLRVSEPHYYVCLNSAARHWGSAHYARQTTQVMVGAQRRGLTVGKVAITFHVQRAIAKAQTVAIRDGRSNWRVSTRETTLLDMIRHLSVIGGLETLARTCVDFAPELTGKALEASLDAHSMTSTAQRLGFVFDTLGMERFAVVVARWLARRPKNVVPLEVSTLVDEHAMNETSRWSVSYQTKQQNILRGFK